MHSLFLLFLDYLHLIFFYNLGADALSRGHDFHRSDTFGEIEVISVLRILTALEDSLGSLGPHVNKILARSLALEQEYYSCFRIFIL